MVCAQTAGRRKSLSLTCAPALLAGTFVGAAALRRHCIIGKNESRSVASRWPQQMDYQKADSDL